MKKINFITSSALIESGMILLLLLSFSVSTVAQKIPTVAPSYDVTVTNTAKAPAAPNVLYSQNDGGSVSRPSQDFESGFDIYDCEGADDFIVPSEGWTITAVDAFGSSSGGINLVNVLFYNDAGGTPEVTAFTSFINIAAIDDGSGNLSITLPAGGITLTAGHYWMVVQDAAPFATAGQWFWNLNSVVYNTICHWRNPNDGFGMGATTWTGVDVIWGYNMDFGFVLYGAPLVTTPVSDWAIYFGIFLIASFIFIGYRRRLIA